MTILRFPPIQKSGFPSRPRVQQILFLFVHNNTQHHADTPFSLEEKEEVAYLGFRRFTSFFLSPSSGPRHLPTHPRGDTFAAGVMERLALFYGQFWFWLAMVLVVRYIASGEVYTALSCSFLLGSSGFDSVGSEGSVPGVTDVGCDGGAVEGGSGGSGGGEGVRVEIDGSHPHITSRQHRSLRHFVWRISARYIDTYTRTQYSLDVSDPPLRRASTVPWERSNGVGLVVEM